MFNLGEIYASIKINPIKTQILLCEVRNGKTNTLATKTISTEGMMKNHIIIDKIALSEQISREITKMSDFIQMEIKKVILIVPAKSLKIKKVKSKFELPSEKSVITKSEISTLVSSLKNFTDDSKREIIDVIPFVFYIDGKPTQDIPVGLTGKSIELEALVSSVEKEMYDSYKDTILNSGIEILDILIEPFCLACEISNKTEMDKGVFVVDVALGETTVSKIRKEVLVASTSINAGSEFVDKKIGKFLSVKESQARRYKESFINLENEEDLEVEILTKWKEDKTGSQSITLGDLNKTLISAYTQIFDAIKFVIDKQSKGTPTVIINSNDVNLIGFESWLKSMYKWNIILYKANVIGMNDSSFATLLGSAYYMSQVNKSIGIKNYSTDPFIGNLEDINKHDKNMSTLWVEMFKWSQRLLPKR